MTNKRLTTIFICYALVIICLPLILSYLKVSESINSAIMFSLVVILILVINKYAEVITGLDTDNIKVKFFKSFNIALLIVLFCYITFLEVPIANYLGERDADILAVVLNSIIMMVFGNYVPKVPHNKFVGYRLPWTIKDSDTWRYCHRVMGYTAFPIAILQIILVFFMTSNNFLPFTLGAWLLIPGVLSYIFYKRKDDVEC